MVIRLKENRVSRTYLGGAAIDGFYGKDACTNSYFPEDWTASTVSAYHGDEGIGETVCGTRIPELVDGGKLHMLVKLLHSAERLVIQAHPTVPFAKEFLHSDFGKTECWYFLDCEEGACVYFGFKEGVCRADWERAFFENDSAKMLSMLHRLPVKKGDFIFVDGGVPHAIGAGCFMVELQEPSDLMVVNERFTPSGRQIGEERLTCGLPYEKMFDVYDYTGYTLNALKKKYCPAKKKLADGLLKILGESMTDKFSMYLLQGHAVLQTNCPYRIAIVTEGTGSLNGQAAARGDRFFMANEHEVTVIGEGMQVIVSE